MKINDYKLEIRDEDTGALYVFRNGEKIFVQDIDAPSSRAAPADARGCRRPSARCGA